MAHAVVVVDDAIKEYLLFRGFTRTLRCFESELMHDKDKAFQVRIQIALFSFNMCVQVDKIVNQLFLHISSFDLDALCDFWEHLTRRFFSRLERSFMSSVRKLEVCLKRYYLVHAIQVTSLCLLYWVFHFYAHRTQEVIKFQNFMSNFPPSYKYRQSGGTGLVGLAWLYQPTHIDYYSLVLPFVKNPETHPNFEIYFTRAWVDTFTLSLNNFLSTVFQNTPLPTLLSFDDEQVNIVGWCTCPLIIEFYINR